MKHKFLIFICVVVFLSFATGEGSQKLFHLYTIIDSKVNEEILTKEDIENSAAKDLVELVKQQGIQILDYASYGMESNVSISGFTGGTVNVVVDGIPMNSFQNGTFDFNSIDLNNVERVKICRGGYNSEGFAGAGGTIFIYTKKMTLKKQFALDCWTKSFFYLKNPFDTFSANVNFIIPVTKNMFLKSDGRITFADNDFFYKDYKDQIQNRQNNSVIDGNYALNLTSYFGNGNNFFIDNKFYAGNKEIPGAVNSVDWGIQKDLDNSFSTGIQFPALMNLANLEGKILYRVSSLNYESNSEKSNHLLRTIEGRIKNNIFKIQNSNQDLNFANLTIADFSTTFIDSTNNGNHYLCNYNFTNTATINWGNFKFEFPFSFTGQFNESIKNFVFVPKISLMADYYLWNATLQGYRSTLFPNVNQLYWGNSGYALGNEDLKPEDGWGAEINFTLKRFIIPFSVSAFTNWYGNKIQWSNETGIYKATNVASAYYIGFNFDSTVEFAKYFSFNFKWEYLYNKLLKEGITYGKKIMWTPDNVGTARLNFKNKEWSAYISANYMGKRYTSNLNISYLKPYCLLDAGITFEPVKKIKIYVDLKNALNTQYECVPDYPMPGINLTLGVKYNTKN